MNPRPPEKNAVKRTARRREIHPQHPVEVEEKGDPKRFFAGFS
jgi:hypothetical protein